MGIVKKEDILGYMDSETGELVCSECYDELPTDIVEEQLILESNRSDDDVYFCGTCKKQF